VPRAAGVPGGPEARGPKGDAMSGISSGIGLISGIDTASLIDQLIAIEARPVENLRARATVLDQQRTAFLGLSAQLLSLQNAALRFSKPAFFRQFNSASTNESILTATASDRAVPGTYTFRVHSLVSTHGVISRGFADPDATPIGSGTLSIEVGNGRVDKSTELDSLNGGAGVRRGTIVITDRSGATAEIDLRKALTVSDVLAAINGHPGVNVRASVTGIAANGAEGDRIVIEDLSGPPTTGTPVNLVIADKDGGSTAADLGITANVAADRVDGRDLVRLALDTPLSLLNDGNGVGKLFNGDDLIFTRNGNETFAISLSDVLKLDTDLAVLNHGQGVRGGERIIRITDRRGAAAEIDLTAAQTVGDVRNAISAAGLGISITIVNSRLQIVDTTGASAETAGNLIVEDVVGFAAADLGIAANVEDDDIQGRDIYGVSTVGDVLRAINFAPANDDFVRAEIAPGGNGLQLAALGPFDTLEVSAGPDSTAAADLGLLGATFGNGEAFNTRHLLAGLDTVLLTSLNGGSGVVVGQVSFNGVTLDFSDARTLHDVIDIINRDASASLSASVNSAGTGLELRAASGSAELTVTDVSGSLAADLAIAGTHLLEEGGSVNSGNLQVRYVSRQTLLADLNGGRGVRLGSFQILDSTGRASIVNLVANLETVGQVIDAINAAAPDTIQARINDTGDGIVVIDTSGGEAALTIEDRNGGQAAADLRLAGAAATGEHVRDGSFEIRIQVGGSDTLNDLVTRIREADPTLSAAVLNDGGRFNPYSLTLASGLAGRRGELVLDATGLDFGFSTLTRAQDAVVAVGGASAANPLLVTSSSNTLDQVIPGLTFNLLSAGDEDVSVNVAQDVDGIVEGVRSFVDSYNDIQAAIDQATSFDSETLQRGLLLGDPTVDLIRTRLQRVIQRRFGAEDATISRLTAVGLRLGGGNRLEFDEAKFRAAYQSSPDEVQQLFTTEESGFGAVAKEVLDELSRSFDGVIARKENVLSEQQELINERIDRLNLQLQAKRTRLEAQFAGLESALAALQAQQNSLAELAQLAAATVR